MLKPQTPSNEAQRISALQSLNVLDTDPDKYLDFITKQVQDKFNVSIALISLIDSNRQWFKSKQGLEACETPREISFCGHAILQKDLFEVSDALLDERFCDNPLVGGPPHIRFYAGAPLHTVDGYRIGTLCIIDPKPKTLSDSEKKVLRDFADLVEYHLAHRDYGTHAKSLMDQSFNGIFELDTEGNFIFANTNGAEILKYSVAELSQKTIEQIIAFTTPHFFQSIISNNNLEQKQFFETNLDLIAKDGSIIYAACHFKPILRNGKIASIVMSFNDISNYRANLNAAQELALYDPLTKLPNRLLYLDRVKQALMASKRYQSYVALLFIDLDKFKPINDNYGHLIGDLLLKKIAARLQKCLRKGHDTVARLGGDEFVIILGNLNSDKTTATLEVEKIANKIIKSIRSPLKITLPSTAKDQAISLKCSASIGICLFQNIPESPEITPEYLINSADKAMYVAKKMGGNQIHFFSPGS